MSGRISLPVEYLNALWIRAGVRRSAVRRSGENVKGVVRRDMGVLAQGKFSCGLSFEVLRF